MASKRIHIIPEDLVQLQLLKNCLARRQLEASCTSSNTNTPNIVLGRPGCALKAAALPNTGIKFPKTPGKMRVHVQPYLEKEAAGIAGMSYTSISMSPTHSKSSSRTELAAGKCCSLNYLNSKFCRGLPGSCDCLAMKPTHGHSLRLTIKTSHQKSWLSVSTPSVIVHRFMTTVC